MNKLRFTALRGNLSTLAGGRPADLAPVQQLIPQTTAPDFSPALELNIQLIVEDSIDPDHHTVP